METRHLAPHLLCFSGLPGVGKSTLAQAVAQHLRAPLLAIDDVVDAIPAHLQQYAHPYWDDMIRILLALAGPQLALGLDVVIDSVFMGEDRAWAAALATKHGAIYRPVYVYLADEAIWEARVTARWEALQPNEAVATWARVQQQRQDFWPWAPGQALFVDSVQPQGANVARVLAYLNPPAIPSKTATASATPTD